MRRLTQHVGQSDFGGSASIQHPSVIRRILICRPNHRLGNLLLITPLLKEIVATFPDSQIELFVKGPAARTIFSNYENVARIISLPRKPFENPLGYVAGWIQLKFRRYDMVINVDKRSSSGRLSTKWANAKYRFFGEEADQTEVRHIAKLPVYNLRAGLKEMGIARRLNENIPELSIQLTPAEIAKGQKILRKLTGNDLRTIGIFTNATGDKCYAEDWWKKCYNTLKLKYRDYNIIEILPIENISRIQFKAPTFYSKDIREIGALIANTEVFIGADSGMMHLASAVGTPTIGLFSVTDKSKYEPYNYKSCAINTLGTGHQACFDALDRILTDDRLRQV
jgi:ADP-heptose:LPS heptosyltransferase